MNISSKTKQIVQFLISNPGFVTIQIMAKQMDVSTRTVLRELPAVEEWLAKNGFQLETKKGTGIRLILQPEQKMQLEYLLKHQKADKSYTPEQRQTIILGELMLKEKVTKLYYFSSLLGVTEGTLSHDLDFVEDWLKKYNIRLERKPGLGIYLEGNEKDIRKASIALFYENLDQSQLHNMFMKSVQNATFDTNATDILIQNRLLNLIDVELIPLLENFVQQIEYKIDFQMADDAFAALVVHLAIAVQRIKGSEKITMDSATLDELKATQEFVIAAGLIAPIANAIQIEIPEEEIGYIAMHLKGSRGRGVVYGNDISMIEDFKLIRMTKEIIKIAEEDTGYYLTENEKLLVGLVRHLGPAVNRIRHGLEIRNPLQKDIETLYPQLYKIAQRCALVVEKAEKIQIPESEIAYIAMHIGAALEHNRRKIFSKMRVAVACASGIAVSRLLSSRVEKEFTNIEVVDVISTINMDEQSLQDKAIDFIISTLPIPEAKLPVIVVGPFLDQKEQDKIRHYIEKTIHLEQKPQNEQKNVNSAYQNLIAAASYHQKILSLIERFYIHEVDGYKDAKNMIESVANTETENIAQAKQMSEDLKKREEQGSTILETKGIMLLHCRTEAISDIRFSIIRMKNPMKQKSLSGKKTLIHTVILMLAPLNESKQGLEILSEITRAIVENGSFSDSVLKDEQEVVQKRLSSLLLRFYQQKVENLQ